MSIKIPLSHTIKWLYFYETWINRRTWTTKKICKGTGCSKENSDYTLILLLWDGQTLYLAPQRGCKSLIFVGSQNWEGQSLEESALSWPWFEHVGEKPGFIVILSNLKHTAVLKTSCKNLSWKHFPTSLWSTTMRPLQKGQCLTSLVSRKVLVQPSKTNVVFYKSSALNISFWAIPAIYDLKKEQPTTGIDVLDGQ